MASEFSTNKASPDVGHSTFLVDNSLPAKRLCERPSNADIRSAYLEAGVRAPLSDFLSRRLERLVDWSQLIGPKISLIPDPASIPTLDTAVSRVVRAVTGSERIALVCDHDMDGTGAAAVLWTALVKYFGVNPNLVAVITSHRLTEGYGIGTGVVSRILTFSPGLVISADQGSSDEPRIAALSAAGIEVIVTDHHVIPVEGPPSSAYAVVSPAREDCDYDSHVCGAGVAFLLMAKVRSALLHSGIMRALPSLSGLLDYVAVSTIADCVSLAPDASFINRAFVRYGLELIKKKQRPCWNIFVGEVKGDVDSEVIAYRLAPAIASSGRLDWADVGVRFLIANTNEEAATCWNVLRSHNSERQAIERSLRQRALDSATHEKSPAIALFFEDGHAGVQGIAASRVVEAFGKPCVIFSAKQNGEDGIVLASGSFRSIPEVNVRRALEEISNESPGLLISFGGHTAAAGATIRAKDFERFRELFYSAVSRQLTAEPRPTIYTDGILPDAHHTVETYDAFEELGPFGRGFDRPTFSGEFSVVRCRQVAEGKHLQLRLRRKDSEFDAIWFGAGETVNATSAIGQTARIAYRLICDNYVGVRRIKLLVVGTVS